VASDCEDIASEGYPLNTFSRAFAGRKDCRGTIQGGCVKGNLKVSNVEHHLNGIESLGRYPLLDEGTCCWAVVDFDFKSKQDRKSLAEKHSKRFADRIRAYSLCEKLEPNFRDIDKTILMGQGADHERTLR